MTRGIVIAFTSGLEFCNCGAGKRAIAIDKNGYEYCEACLPKNYLDDVLNASEIIVREKSAEEQVENFLYG
jgi:hypothetical protein